MYFPHVFDLTKVTEPSGQCIRCSSDRDICPPLRDEISSSKRFFFFFCLCLFVFWLILVPMYLNYVAVDLSLPSNATHFDRVSLCLLRQVIFFQPCFKFLHVNHWVNSPFLERNSLEGAHCNPLHIKGLQECVVVG